MMDDGWIEHNGMACPVSENVRVVVRFRNGTLLEHRLAGDWEWNHTGEGRDIIAYKLADPIAERIAKSGFIPDKSGHTVVAKPRLHIFEEAMKHITEATWERWYMGEWMSHDGKTSPVPADISEEDEKKTVTPMYLKANLWDKWKERPAHWMDRATVAESAIAAKDARIAELEKQVTLLKETLAERDESIRNLHALIDQMDSGEYHLGGKALADKAHALLGDRWVPGVMVIKALLDELDRLTAFYMEMTAPIEQDDSRKALALSFAPDPSDPRLGRNSGR